MTLMDLFKNYVNALTGTNQEFEELLAAKDISGAKDKMVTHQDRALDALREYNTFTHEIMKREDKIVTDKKGNFLRKEPVWKYRYLTQSTSTKLHWCFCMAVL